MTGRSRALLALIAVLVLSLTACAGLPTTGSVHAGPSATDEESDSDFIIIPDGPAPDASPEQIVEGFIAAGSGSAGNWATAREFLAEAVQSRWSPTAGVIVDRTGDRTLTASGEDGFVLSVDPVSTVDETGALSGAGDEGEITLGFTLVKNSDDQWRISEAPNGIVLDQSQFRAVFGAYSVMYFDPSWTYLVPDQRWFPRTNAPTSIAKALVDGVPSPWLKDSVATAFTDAARMAQPTVPVRSNAAEVSLEVGALALDDTVRGRMQAQLEASLLTAGILEVEMMVDDRTLSATAVPVRATRVDSRSVVITDAGLGFLSGSSVEPIPGLSEAMAQVDAAAVEINADRTAAAVLTTAGAAVEIRSDGAALVLDSRSGLVAPSIDPLGYTWVVAATEPGAVVAYGADGSRHPVAGAWPGAAEITAMRVSRDGTRVAATVRRGERSELWVAGVVRDRDGIPTGLGEPVVLAALPGTGTEAAWLDASTVAVLAAEDDVSWLHEQSVGGAGSVLRAIDGANSVAGGNQAGSARVLAAGGELFLQSSTNWQHLAEDVSVLAVQQGAPR